MVFEFFKNIDFQGLQKSLEVVIFSFFQFQAVVLRPPSAVKGLIWFIYKDEYNSYNSAYIGT